MIRTSSYKECQTNEYKTYSISGDRGKDANYHGDCYPNLAPKLGFWRTWKDNRGKIPEEENIKYYIDEYYKQVLSKLNPHDVYYELNNSILLCYEDNMDFCHRHIVAAWLELFLDIDVPEVVVRESKIKNVDRPEYIKNCLEKTIKSNRNVHGFNSLSALLIFEESEQMEKLADNYNYGTQYWCDYKNEACFLRCLADDVEDNYNQKNSQKVLKKAKF